MSALAGLTEHRRELSTQGQAIPKAQGTTFDLLAVPGYQHVRTADFRAGAFCRPAPQTQQHGEPGRLQGTHSTEATVLVRRIPSKRPGGFGLAHSCSVDEPCKTICD